MSNPMTSREGNSPAQMGGHDIAKIAAGMASYGPDHPDYPNAPNDWDGGPYLCRDGGLYHMRGYGWQHGLGCWNPTADWDRVGYTSLAHPKEQTDEQ